MGICSCGQKFDGIIDNQSQYEIIYHVSGSKKQLVEFEKLINVGPKVGVGLDEVELEGLNYQQRELSKALKYRSEVAIQPRSFCSLGLNKIQAGCFLSVYATRMNEKGQQIYKKLIFKDIYIQTNQDVCLRVNKNFSLKQLTFQQIEEMKRCFAKEESNKLSFDKQKNDKQKRQSQDIQLISTILDDNTEYVKNIFGLKYYQQNYTQLEGPEVYELDHSNVKINLKLFLNYDWTSLQGLWLNNCGINDTDWKILCLVAPILFKKLKQLWLAGNKISTITKKNLQRFPSLEVINLDYSLTEEVNPLTQATKAEIISYSLQHPQVRIYSAIIDQNEILDIGEYKQEQQIPNQSISKQPSSKGSPLMKQKRKKDSFLILDPATNSVINQRKAVRNLQNE